MSSDCFYVRIGNVVGTKVTMHCLTGFAGGLDDIMTSRSFGLSLLLDASTRASDVSYGFRNAPPKEAERMLALADCARELGSTSALHAALPNPHPWDAEWHRLNCPKIVVATRLLGRFNHLPESELRRIATEIESFEQPWPHLRMAWERLHRFALEIEVTDPKYLAHLVQGLEFGTTAFDAWNESPRR